MSTCCLFSLAVTLLTATVCAAEPARLAPAGPEPDAPRYELQVITAKPGKLDALHAGLAAHHADVLAKRGGTLIGSFTPAGENPDGRILCLLKFPGLHAASTFSRPEKAAPLWRPSDTASGADDPEVLVERVQVMHLRPTDYSPPFEPGQSPQPRVFELRTYTCPSPEKLARLHGRFREHTMGLFAKHGMKNLIYWQPLDGEGADRQLVYLLAHTSQAAAKESFAAFRADPDWLAVKRESEQHAGGSLTNADKGVVSEFFNPTEYSPLK